MKTAAERIPYLDSIRAIAIIMVVGVHTSGYTQLEGDMSKVVYFIVPRPPLIHYTTGEAVLDICSVVAGN